VSESRGAVPSPPAALDEQVLFRSLFAAYPDALIVADSRGTIVLANPAAAELLHYPIDGLLGINVDALVPDSIRPRHESFRQAYARNPISRPMGSQVELVAKRRDGTEVMVEIALSPLQDHGLPLVVAAIRDISAYPRVQQAMSRARYSEFVAQLGRAAVDARDPHVLFERLPSICAEALHVDVVRVFLLESNRLEFRVAAGVGALPDEEVGMRVANRVDTPPGFVVHHGRPVFVEDYASERRFAVPPTYLQLGLTSSLAVPLSDRGRPIGALSVRSREPRRFGVEELRFLESLANLLAASLQRAQSEEDLNHAQRMESVGQLTGGIAHDFNNLLTVIQGNLQMLQELPRLVDDDYGQQLVGSASRAARRGAELTSKLLAFSRRQLLQPGPVDVAQLCHSLADMLRRTVDQRIVIAVEVAGRCPPALADAGQLESALLNIAINARDAMPDGGSLGFVVGACEGMPAKVHHELQGSARPHDGYVSITVADSGSGMSDEVKERAFEPFFTTKQSGRGTGLGLSTVYGFVKQSHGAITIDSAPGRGTRVTLYLPQVRRSVDAPQGDVIEPHTMPAGLRVLLVEDDPEVAAVARGFLQAASCQVAHATSGEQALRLLESGAAFDLMLSDIALGHGMRGTALAEATQRLKPRLPVLLMTGYSSQLPDAPSSPPVQWEVLLKPFSRHQLQAAIARVMSVVR
jgi:PAS domain S-box-containing protein